MDELSNIEIERQLKNISNTSVQLSTSYCDHGDNLNIVKREIKFVPVKEEQDLRHMEPNLDEQLPSNSGSSHVSGAARDTSSTSAHYSTSDDDDDDKLNMDEHEIKFAAVKEERDVTSAEPNLDEQLPSNTDSSLVSTATEDIFTCGTCFRAYPTKRTLRNHTFVHTRQFKCEHCDNKFASRAHLNNHAQTHAGEGPQERKKRFCRRCDVKRHPLTHTEEKPVQCHIGGNGFTWQAQMNAHVKSSDVSSVGAGAAEHIMSGGPPLDCCVLDQLFAVSFGDLSFEEKREIITNGRPTPRISIKTKMKNYNRNFKTDYFASSKWLTACKSRNKLYCWPCVLFHTENEVWNKEGFCDMSNFHKAKLRHEKCYSHLSAITKLKTFGRTRIDSQSSEQERLHVLKHNAEVDSNRELMKRLIDVCCFLAKQELPFRGDNEREDSANHGNFVELTQLLSKYDSKLNYYLHSTGLLKGPSNRIQNDIIICVGDVILDKIKSEINDAFFATIMLDETTDIAGISQFSTVVRYVKDGNVQERFVGFTDVSSDHTGTALSEHVFQILSRYNCEQKLVAQSYVGTATCSGHLNSLQSLVKEKCNSALFIHCSAHRLILVLSQSVNHIKECKIFFKTLSGISNFFSHSLKSVNELAESEIMKRFPSVANTSWNYSSRIVNAVNNNRAQLLEFFEGITEDTDIWDAEALMIAKGYVSALQDFDFAFLLKVFSSIVSLTGTLFDILQSKTLDVKYCVEKVKETISNLRDAKRDFEDTYRKVELNDNVKPPKKVRREDDQLNTEMKYVRLYNEIIDAVIGQMEARFHDLSELQFLELLDSNKFKSFKTQFPDDLFFTLKSSYGSFFHFGYLRSELVSVYRLSDFSNKTVTEMMHFLKETGLSEEAFSETYKLCCLVSTIPLIPVSTSTVERTFSCLKRIKTSVHNTQSEIRLSTLSLLSIEKGLLDELQSQRSFYDPVIEKFLQKGERRIPLTYK